MQTFIEILKEEEINEAVAAIGAYFNRIKQVKPRDKKALDDLEFSPEKETFEKELKKLPQQQQKTAQEIHDNLKQYAQTGNTNFLSKAKALGISRYPSN